MTWAEIYALAALIVLVVNAVLIPLVVHVANNKKKKEKNDATLEQVPEMIQEIRNGFNDFKEEVRGEFRELKSKQDSLESHLDTFETQELKYMINDAFFGYESVRDIPYETLLGAAQNCDLYIGKGLNHEIGARCNVIYAEIERRQREKAGGHGHE